MNPRPPRLATWLLTRFLPHHSAEALTGDLTETWQRDIRPRQFAWRANLWYWRETVRALRGMTAADLTGTLPPVGTSQIGGVFPDLIADLRHAWRLIRRSPLFTITCVALFGVGIGANATIVLFLDSRVTHPVPGIPGTDSILHLDFARPIGRENPGVHGPRISYLWTDEWHLMEDQLASFSGIAASATQSARVDDGVRVTDARVAVVTRHFFEILRLPMAVGATPGVFDGLQSAVISHAYWQSHLGGDPRVIGRVISINRTPFTVIGVANAEFRGLGELDITGGKSPVAWVSAASLTLVFGARAQTGLPFLDIIGRIAPGVAQARAAGELDAVARRISSQLHPASPVERGAIMPLGGSLTARLMKLPRSFWFLPALILLVACTNVSVLLLGRGVVRQREIALRLSLGAGRARIVRLLLVESLMLGLFGALAGILFAFETCRLLGAWYPGLFASGPIVIGWHTALSAVLLATGTGLAFGVLPALHATRTSLGAALRSADSGRGRHRSRLQESFVVMEMALSMALVCSTGLIIEKIYPIFLSTTGFDISANVMTTDIDLMSRQFTAEQTNAYLASVTQRLLTHPEVEAVGTIDHFPVGFSRYINLQLNSDGSGSRTVTAGRVMVDPGYFAGMRLAIRAGRDFSSGDMAGTPTVAVVGQRMADQLWPGDNAIGKRLRVRGPMPAALGDSAGETLVTVIGVTADQGLLDTDRMAGLLYLSRQQARYAPTAMDPHLTLVIRTRSPGPPLIGMLQSEIAREDPAMVTTEMRTVRERFASEHQQFLALAMVGMSGGLVTLLMACAGIYAVIGFSISQRRREIAVRVALGARSAQVVGLFFREGFRLAFIGFGLGVPLALAGMLVLVSGEQEAAFLGPVPVLGLVALLLGVAMLASWLPSRRALRIDPMRALQGD